MDSQSRLQKSSVIPVTGGYVYSPELNRTARRGRMFNSSSEDEYESQRESAASFQIEPTVLRRILRTAKKDTDNESDLTLLQLLRATGTVMRAKHARADEKTAYYHSIIGMNTSPGHTWEDKLNSFLRSRPRHLSGTHPHPLHSQRAQTMPVHEHEYEHNADADPFEEYLANPNLSTSQSQKWRVQRHRFEDEDEDDHLTLSALSSSRRPRTRASSQQRQSRPPVPHASRSRTQRGKSAGPSQYRTVIGGRYEYSQPHRHGPARFTRSVSADPTSSSRGRRRTRAKGGHIPIVEDALKAVAPVDVVAHRNARLMRVCLRAWRAHAVWAAEAREDALEKWTTAIAFWEQNLLHKALLHWRKLRILPQLQLRAAEDHHRRTQLSLGLVAFAVNMQRARWHRQKMYLAATCWARHVESRCLRAWRRFAADRMSHVLGGLPMRSAGMMAAVLHWVHVSLGVHVRAVFPQDLLITSDVARQHLDHHNAIVQARQDDEVRRGVLLGETTSVFVKRAPGYDDDDDGFSGDSHLGAIIALCPTERRRRVLAESLAAVNRRWMRFLLYVWRINARRVMVMRVKCLRRQLRDRLRHWKTVTADMKKDNMKVAHITKTIHTRITRNVFEQWRTSHLKRERLMRAEALTIDCIRHTVLRAGLVKWRNALARRHMFHLANRHNSGNIVQKSFRKWFNYVYSKREQAGKDSASFSGVMQLKARRYVNVWHEALRLKRMRKRALVQWQNATVAKCLYRWIDYLDHRHAVREAQAKADELYRKQSLQKAMSMWQEGVSYQMRINNTLKTTLLARFGRVQSAVFNAWRMAVKEKIAKRAAVVGKLKWFSLHKALRSWRLVTNGRIRERELAVDLQTAVKDIKARHALVTWSKQLYYVRCIRKVYAQMAMREVKITFIAWHDYAVEQKRVNGVLKRAAARMQNRVLASCFSSWTAFVDRNKYVRDVTSKILDNHGVYLQQRVFQAWKEEHMAKKERDAKLKSHMSKMLNSGLHRAFSTWVEWVESRKAERALINRAFKFWTNQSMYSAFSTWREFAINERENRENVSRALAYWQNSKMASAFDTWVEWTREQVSAKAQVQKAVSMWRNRQVSQAFNTWIEFVEDQKHARDTTKKALSWWTQGLQARVFNAWMAHAAAAKEVRLKQQRAMSFWTNSTLYAAFNQWRDFTVESAAHRAAVKRAVSLWTNGTLSRSFRTWHSNVAAIVADKNAVKKAVLMWQNQKMAMAFSTWQEYTYLEIKERELVELLEHNRLHRAFDAWHTGSAEVSMQRKAMSFWVNGAVARTFKHWHGVVLEEKRKRDILTRVAKRWHNLQMATAFNVLRDHWQMQTYKRELRETAAKHYQLAIWSSGMDMWSRMLRARLILKRLMMREVAAAFRTWWNWTIEHSAKSRRRAEIMNKIYESQKQRYLGSAFEMLHQHALEMRQVRRACNMMLKAKLARAFRTWRDFTDIRIGYKAAEASLREKHNDMLVLKYLNVWRDWTDRHFIMKNFVTRMLNMQAARAFDTWRTFTDKRVAVREAYAEYTEQATRRTMIRVMSKWMEAASLRARLRHITAIWSGRDLKTTFEAWHRFAVSRRRKLAMDRQNQMLVADAKIARYFGYWREALRRKLIFKHAVMLFAGRSLETCFHAWRLYTDKQQEKMQIAEAHAGEAAIKMDRQSLRKCWNGWKQFHEDAQAEKRAIRKAMELWGGNKLAQAFRRWIKFVDAQKDARARVAQAAAHWKNASMARAFYSWREYVEEMKEDQGRMGKAVKMWENRVLGSAFRQWEANAQELGRQRRVMQRAVARMANVRMAGVFDRWVEFVSQMKEKREAVEEAVRFWSNASLARSFRTWHDNVQAQIEEREMLERVAARWRNKQVAACFDKWVSYVDDRRIKCELAEHADDFRRASLLSKHWVDWLRMRKMKVCARRLLNSRATAALNSWLAYAVNRREKRERRKEMLEEARRLSDRRLLRRCIDNFKENVADAERMRHILVIMEQSKVSRCLNSWIAFARYRAFYKEVGATIERNHMERTLRNVLDTWRAEARKKQVMQHFIVRMKNRHLASAFDSWYHVTSRRLATFDAAQQLETSLNVKRVQASFDTWRNATDLRLRLATVTSIWRGRDLQTTFESWRRYTVDQRRKLAKDRQNQEMILEGMIRRYMYAWREATTRKLKLRSALMRFSMKSVNIVFQAWHNLTIANRKDWNAIGQFEEMVTTRQKRRAFQGWLDVVNEEKAHRAAMEKAVKMMMNRTMGGAFNRWLEFVEERKHEREVMAHALKMMVNRRIAAAWNRWVSFVDMRNHHREMAQQAEIQRVHFIWRSGLQKWFNMYRLRIVARRIMNHRVYAAFKSWRDYARSHSEKAQRRAEIVEKVLARYRNRALIAGFNALRDHAAEQATIRRAAAKLLQSRVLRAFNAWKQYANYRLYYRECYEELAGKHEELVVTKYLDTWREAAHRISVLRVFLTRMQNRTLHQSLMSWHLVTHKRLMVFEAFDEYTEQSRRRTMIHVMSKWSEAASLRARLRHITAIWHGRDLKTTFEAWHRFAVSRRRKLAMDRQNQMLILETKTRRYLHMWLANLERKKKLHWVMMKFHSKTLHMVFREWHQLTVASAERREAAAEAFGFKQDRLMQKYFDRWREYAVEESKQKELLRRVVGRLQQRKLAAAFDTWHENASWLAQIRKAVEMFTGKNDKRRLRDSFSSWREYVDNRKDMLQKYARIVSLHGDRLQAVSFQAWRDWVAQKIRLKRILVGHMEEREGMLLELNFKAWRKYAGRQALLKKNIEKHAARAPYLRVIRRWHRLYAEKVHQKQLLDRVARMWQNRNLASAFRTWLYFTKYKSHLQEAFAQIDDTRSRRIVRKSIEIWRENAEERSRLGWISDQLEETINNRLAYNSLVLWRERAEFSRKCASIVEILWGKRRRALHAQVFTAWKVYVSRKKEKESSIAKGLRFWTNSTLRAAWATWRDFVDEQSRRKYILRKALGAMQHAELAWSFQKWMDVVREAKVKQAAALEFFAHTEEGSKRRMFDRWRDWVSEQKHQREVLSRAMAAMRLRHLRSAFTSWSAFAAGRVAECIAFDTMVERNRARTLHKYITVWYGDMKRNAAALVLLADREDVKMKSVLKRWRTYARNVAKDRDAGIEMTIRNSRRAALKALAVWREETDRKQRIRKALARWQHSLLSQAMESWWQFLEHRREERADKFYHDRIVAKSFYQWTSLGAVNEQFRAQNEMAVQHYTRRILTKWHDRAMVMQNVRYLFGQNQKMDLRLRFQRWRFFTQYQIALYRRAEYLAVRAARNSMRQRIRAWRLQMLVTKHFRRATLRRCLHGWRTHVEGINKYRDAVLRHRHILLRVEQILRRHEYQQAQRCFSAWKETAVVDRESWKTAADFRKTHLCGQVFSQWKQVAAVRADRRKKMEVIAVGVRARELREVITIWHHDAMRLHEVTLIVQEYHEQVRINMLRKVWKAWKGWTDKGVVANKMAIRSYAPYLDVWRHELALKNAEKAAMTLRLQNTVRHSFEKWRYVYLDLIATNHYENRLYESTLTMWRDQAREIRNERVAEEFNRRRQLKFIFGVLHDARIEFYACMHYNRRILHTILSEWKVHAHRSAGLRRVCEMIKTFTLRNTIVAAIREWHAISAHAKRRRSAVVNLLRGTTETQQLQQTFDAWRKFVLVRKVMLTGMEDVVQNRGVNRQRKEMRICFARWRKHAGLKKRIRQMIDKWDQRRFVSSFHAWAIWASKRTSSRWQQEAAIKYHQRRSLAMAFFSWRMEVRAAKWAADYGSNNVMSNLDNVVVHVSVSLARLTEGIRILSPLTSLSQGPIPDLEEEQNLEILEKKRWEHERELLRDRRLSAAKSIGDLPAHNKQARSQRRIPRSLRFMEQSDEPGVDEMLLLIRPGAPDDDISDVSVSPTAHAQRGLTEIDEVGLKESMLRENDLLSSIRRDMTPTPARPVRREPRGVSVVRGIKGEGYAGAPGIVVHAPRKALVYDDDDDDIEI